MDFRQELLVMTHLREHGSITQKEAAELYGISRLSAVIFVLRHKRGFIIHDKTEHGENRFGIKCHWSRYYL